MVCVVSYLKALGQGVFRIWKLLVQGESSAYILMYILAIQLGDYHLV